MLDELKRRAAEAALAYVEDGMRLGLGSGSTAAHFVRLLGRRVAAGLDVAGVPTSEATAQLARAAGVPLTTLDDNPELDLDVDGADEIGPDLALIKGGGAALLREKIVVAAAERFVVVAEERKRVPHLGATFKLPVEVVRFGWRDTRRRVLELLTSADLRTADGGEPVVTDEGHHLLDCELPPAGDLPALAEALKGTVGVVEHGLFLGMADEALLGRADGSLEVVRPG